MRGGVSVQKSLVGHTEKKKPQLKGKGERGPTKKNKI